LKTKHFFLGVFLIMLALILPRYTVGPFNPLYANDSLNLPLWLITMVAWWGAIICLGLSVYDLFRKQN